MNQTITKAAALIDKAIEHYETYGFNVKEFGGPEAPACYIGALRLAAGLSASPPTRGCSVRYTAACAPDPLPLEYAFAVLDCMADLRHEARWDRRVDCERGYAGGLAESLAEERDHTTEDAIAFLREARAQVEQDLPVEIMDIHTEAVLA